MKYELTEDQRKNLLKYYELIKSNDEESILLGIQLFYNEFKDFRCPVKKLTSGRIYYDFCKLKNLIICLIGIIYIQYIEQIEYLI